MTKNSQYFVLVLVFLVCSTFFSTSIARAYAPTLSPAPAPAPYLDVDVDDGGTLDPNDREVISLAESFVDEYNQENKMDLVFGNVTVGLCENNFQGEECNIILFANDGVDWNQYKAIFEVKEDSEFELKNFTKIYITVNSKPAYYCVILSTYCTSSIPQTHSLINPREGQDQSFKIGPCLSSGRPKAAARRLSPSHTTARKISVPENGGPDPTKLKAVVKPKIKTPANLVQQTRDLLLLVDHGGIDAKMMIELSKVIRELKKILYGDSESEPVPEACSQLTQEFFRENTLRVLITCIPKLNLETRKDATQVVANLQRQQVHSRLIACDYLDNNLDLMDVLISGYENTELALHYGSMLRECIRHQSVARHVLESEHMKKFFEYIQVPNFDIASDAAATFKELLTRHKSTVAEFLSKNYDWFFAEYNTKLLESTNYITKRQAIKLLGDMLLDRSNSAVMTRYVSSRDNLRILMTLLRESSKSIHMEAFHVFKLFVANQNKPADIVSILVTNRSKLLRVLADFKTDKEDEQFEADKAQVVKEIAALEPKE